MKYVLKYAVVKRCTSHHEDGHEHAERTTERALEITHTGRKSDNKYEADANALMSTAWYKEYIKRHGYHFTESLAEYASKNMVNANGQLHSWTTSQVKKSVEGLGISIPSNVTIGDITYAANMAYADFYPELLRDEVSCIKYAHKVATDPDGYEGIIFCRWIADVIGKSIKLNWEKFI